MRMLRSILSALLAIGVLSAPAFADDEKVPVDKLPKPILTTLKKRFPKAVLVEAVKETDGDDVEFEVWLKVGMTEYDITLTPDGKITHIDKAITAKDLPKAVAAALEKAYPKAKGLEYGEVTQLIDGKESIYFSIIIETVGKKTLEVEISPAGKIIKTEEQ